MKSSPDISSLATGQAEMLPLVLTGIRPGVPQGQHIELIGEVRDSVYYCKGDRCGLPVCATEWFYSSLAEHIGIPVPDYCKIENPENGSILFGSKETWGTAEPFEVQTLLTTPPDANPIIGDPYPWLNDYLSQVYTLDLFASNPDRQPCNFLLVPHGHARRLLAFDFASSRLIFKAPSHFPIARTQTLLVGRQLRKLRGFVMDSASEILERIKAVPISKIESILSAIPPEWITETQRGQVYEQWSGNAITERIQALARGLKDGSVL